MLKSSGRHFVLILKISFPALQLEQAEQKVGIASIGDTPLELTCFIVSPNKLVLTVSESLSVWLAYINCPSMPRCTLNPIQVMTIKRVLPGVRALQSALCYFCLTLRVSVLLLHPFRETCIFLHSLVHELSFLFPGEGPLRISYRSTSGCVNMCPCSGPTRQPASDNYSLVFISVRCWPVRGSC